MIIIPIAIIAAAALILTREEKPTPPAPEEKPKNPPEEKPKKYTKEFRLAALKWLRKNPPPEGWQGTKIEYAELEMVFDGKAFEE